MRYVQQKGLQQNLSKIFLYCKSVFPASSNTGRAPYDKPPFVFIKVQSAHQIIRLLLE